MADPEYQLLPSNPGMVERVRRLRDNAFIPNDKGNKDSIEYQNWLAEGNEPLPVESD